VPRLARITRAPIEPGSVLSSVRDDVAGGSVLFVGTIRNRSEGRTVKGLTYEVYKEMAEKRMDEIEEEVKRRWPIKKMTMVHRYGGLKVGDVSVAVAVSCEHRADAFDACRYAIDTIKRTLPIWKKERFGSGAEAWVKGTPIED
jgi:molybdopterin synthase catalytic subunit